MLSTMQDDLSRKWTDKSDMGFCMDTMIQNALYMYFGLRSRRALYNSGNQSALCSAAYYFAVLLCNLETSHLYASVS